jgi:outer membrane protein assembly factor BamB
MRRIYLVCALLVASSVHAAQWPQWRGPNFNGSSDERNLPTQWSKTANVAWSAALPGAAASTPIIFGPRVFLSGINSAAETLQALCFDRVSGKLLWQHDVGTGTHRDARSNYASSSPVTDGRQVVFFYSTGDLISFDNDGNRRWARNIQADYGEFAFLWTFSTSPVLYGGKLYLQVLQRDVPIQDRGLKNQENQSYLLAMDPDTGKTLWRVIRPSQAVAESREAFTTPMPYEYQGRKQLLLAGGDCLTAHDPDTGKELWRWGTWNPKHITHWRLVPSPVAGDGVALACAPKRDPIYAVKADGSGVLDPHAVAWASTGSKEISSDVPTPAFYDGDFFILSDVRKCLSRVEPHTGKVKWTVPTPGGAKYEASPLAADGKIYLLNVEGQAAVLSADKGEVLHTIPMAEPADNELVRSSIAVADGQLFIRTAHKLYCVGRSTDGAAPR